MATYVFQASLLNDPSIPAPGSPSDVGNFPNTKSTFIPNSIMDNRILKNGNQFTATGLNGLYYYNNYTTGVNPPLILVSKTLGGAIT